MWHNILYLLVTVLASVVRGERHKAFTQCLDKRSCEPSYICSPEISLNECQHNYTIELDHERDVVIYQRNVSDGRPHSCTLSGSDCKVTTNVGVVVMEEKVAGDTCNGTEVCALMIRIGSSPTKTACNGNYFAVLSYRCIAPELTTSDSQPDERDNSVVVAGILVSVAFVLVIVAVWLFIYKPWRPKHPTAQHSDEQEETRTKARPSIEIIRPSAPHLNKTSSVAYRSSPQTDTYYVLPWQGGVQCKRQDLSPDLPVYEDPRDLCPTSIVRHPQALGINSSKSGTPRENCYEGTVGEALGEDTYLYDGSAVQILTENELYESG